MTMKYPDGWQTFVPQATGQVVDVPMTDEQLGRYWIQGRDEPELVVCDLPKTFYYWAKLDTVLDNLSDRLFDTEADAYEALGKEIRRVMEYLGFGIPV